MSKTVKAYITLARPHSWLKNVFIFVPIVFSLGFVSLFKLADTAIVFIAFCLAASGVYALNDICDAAKDSTHPVKKDRPIPSGLISKANAAVFAAALAATGLSIGLYIDLTVGILFAAYIVLNISYSLRLKHIPVIDCFCIALGFILRIYIGGAASGDPISQWLFLTVAAMSLFMAFGKRRGELIKNNISSARKVLQHYNADFLQGMIYTFAGLSIVFYSLWALDRGEYMIYTVPLILFIVVKYLLLIYNADYYGDPTAVILNDKVLLISAGIYGLLTMLLLYIGGPGING